MVHTALLIVVISPPLATAESPRLFETEPFDQITLKDAQKTVLKVHPLQLPDRQIPSRPRSGDKLRVRLLDESRQEYEVTWGNIQEIKLFEQMVLDAAVALVVAGEFDEAFDYYEFMQAEYPNWPGLDAAIDRYLFEDARSQARLERHESALALLGELYARNAKFDGLQPALAATMARIVEERVARSDHFSARRLLRALSEKYPAEPLVAEWEARLEKEALERTQAAEAQWAAGNRREAQETALAAARIWPALPRVKQILADMAAEHPFVVVGVTSTTANVGSDAWDDWASRRIARLLERGLFEMTGYGTEGGEYTCSVGEYVPQPVDRKLTIHLRRDLRWSSGAALTATDVARDLLVRSDSSRTTFCPAWADLLGSVSVSNVFTLDVSLRRNHVRPEAMLLHAVVPWHSGGSADDDAAPSQANGPYQTAGQVEGVSYYRASDHYFAGDSGPREIVERFLAESRPAIDALAKGEIAVIDRVAPWEIERARQKPPVVVEPYAAPLIHCLVPNLRKPLAASRTFRRALVYGINRERILRRDLLAGAESSESQVTSGPFPVGYAYDTQVEVRPYEPALALSLASIAQRQVVDNTSTQGDEPGGKQEAPADAKSTGRPGDAAHKPALATIRLAHAPREIARRACGAIRDDLKKLGIAVQLIELPPSRDRAVEYDFLYAELAIWDAIVDAPRIFGSKGPLAGASPYLDLALEQLASASDWKAARERLLEVHRIIADEALIVPLWQLADHFAYDSRLAGIGPRPVTLYQHVDAWRRTPWLPADAP